MYGVRYCDIAHDDMLCGMRLKYVYSLNDLAVTGKDSFYFSNTKRYCYTMELITGLPFGSVGYYNGSQAQLVEEDLFMPNGLALSDDSTCVELANFMALRRVYTGYM